MKLLSKSRLLATSERYCNLCKCRLDDPKRPVASKDCGGDCCRCMALSDDPDCYAEMSKVEPEHFPPKEQE